MAKKLYLLTFSLSTFFLILFFFYISNHTNHPPNPGLELIEVFQDARGKVVLYRDTLGNVHAKGKVHKGSVVYIYDEEKGMLLLQRSMDLKLCPGQWSIVGEHAKPKETPRQTAKRGVKEELGIDIDAKELVDLGEKLFQFEYEDLQRIDFQITARFLWKTKNLALTEEKLNEISMFSGLEMESLANLSIKNPIYMDIDTTETANIWFLSPRDFLEELDTGDKFCHRYFSNWYAKGLEIAIKKLEE